MIEILAAYREDFIGCATQAARKPNNFEKKSYLTALNSQPIHPLVHDL